MKRFFGIAIVPMLSLGSFRIKKGEGPLKDKIWWYEFTLLFLEVTWGKVDSNIHVKYESK